MPKTFNQLVTDAQRSAINAAKRKNLMARTLAHEPEPKPPPYTGRSYESHGAYRIAEIERIYDPAWPDQGDALMLGAHHAREAANVMEACAKRWLWNCGPGGFRNRPLAVIRMINALVPRINPALHAAEREFDAQGLMRSRYEAMEAKARSEIAGIAAKFKKMREGAGRGAKIRIRSQEFQELQVVLDDFAAALQPVTRAAVNKVSPAPVKRYKNMERIELTFCPALVETWAKAELVSTARMMAVTWGLIFLNIFALCVWV